MPNEALDLQRASTSPYDNAGSTELASLMAEAELVDVARECLGDEPFFTSHHNVQGNTTTHTRIDQLYAPDRDGLTWSHVPVQEELFPRPRDAMQLDHNMIEIEVSETTGDRGRDLQTIREDIYENAAFNANLEKIITNTIEMAQPEDNRTWAPVWIRIKELVFEASINETRRKNRERNAELADKKARRNGLKEHIDKGTATPQQTQEYIELTEEINRAATRTPSARS